MTKFRGGGKLQAALKEIGKKVGGVSSLKTGFMSGATYPDGTSVPMVAAIQEFGAPAKSIPPRPYFRGMIADKSKEWAPTLAGLLTNAEYDAKVALETLGDGIAGQLRQSIVDTMEPPLSPVTLMLRKMRADNPDLVVTGATVGEAAARVAAGESTAGAPTKPLVDTGHLLNSITSTVETK